MERPLYPFKGIVKDGAEASKDVVPTGTKEPTEGGMPCGTGRFAELRPV